MAWLKLIRWKNLAIILLTQFLVWWCVILPERPAVLNPLHFSLVAFSTILIAAAGYIINDYFDIKIDLVNRPDKVILEKAIPRKQAIISHTVLNIIALFLAGYVAARAHHYEWLALQLICTLLLWFYSTHFKRQYITGNVVISLLAALTIVVLFIYEPVLQHDVNMPLMPNGIDASSSSLPAWVLGIYAYFAFMLTWMREIVKDMEDHIGDEGEGCKTLPVVRGLKYATYFVFVLAALVVIPLAAAAVVLFRDGYTILALYIAAILIIPLIAWSIFLNKTHTSQHYHKTSTQLKIIMLLGIISILIYQLQLHFYLAGQ